jgi:ATP-dependent DNA ligase
MDGFRCLVFRDGSSTELQSKAGQPLTRYFPELQEVFARFTAEAFVLDGEIAVPVHGHFSFDDLLQRIHPAASRVKRLAAEMPAVFIAFDLLVDASHKSLVDAPLSERRKALETFARKFFRHSSMRLSPSTTNFETASRWLEGVGGDLDGIIAKRLDLPYMSGERTGMQKIKKIRTADCVVGGFRYAEKRKVVGSLLLGLFDSDGLLHHVGFCSAIKESEKAALTSKLEKLAGPPGFTGRAPGGPSRWSTKRSTEWTSLQHKLVVEVSYDHFTGGRFRHGTSLMRWRPDKDPRQCTMDQVVGSKGGSLELLRAA